MTVLAFHGVKGLGENSLCSQAWTQWSMIAGITLVGLVCTINHKLLLQLLVQTVCTPNPLHFGLALRRDDSRQRFTASLFALCSFPPMTQYLVVLASTDNGGLWIKERAKGKNGLINGRGREERNGEHSKRTKQDIKKKRGTEYDVR